jgi:hypothetical protein
MSASYRKIHRWPPFVHKERMYDLSHLDEYCVETLDSGKVPRKISVTFSDHCFTRDYESGDDPSLIYPNSSRQSGCFCHVRYELSLGLKDLLGTAFEGRDKVWMVRGENMASIPTVDSRGQSILYGIVFSLDRVKKLPVDLDLRVRSAYPCDSRTIVTYGSVRFAHLVTLRMQNKFPKEIHDRNRKRPGLRS